MTFENSLYENTERFQGKGAVFSWKHTENDSTTKIFCYPVSLSSIKKESLNLTHFLLSFGGSDEGNRKGKNEDDVRRRGGEEIKEEQAH